MRDAKKVFIGTPFGRDPVFRYMLSLVDTTKLLAAERVSSHYFAMEGASDLAYARNQIAAMFLASDCTDLLWIDSDIGWEPKSVLRLLDSDKDFVTGGYRKKCEEIRLAAAYAEEGFERDADGLWTIGLNGMGFAKTSRRVFERIMAAQPGLHREKDDIGDGLDLWRFFAFTGDGPGEDVRFCKMWRDLGEKIWMDPEIELSHIGAHDYYWSAREAGLL